jgi:hypothetical protein
MTENTNQLPNLPTPPVKAEPASEWANSTISALDSAEPTSQPPAVTTPGPEVPGAYPPTPGAAPSVNNGLSLNNVKETAKEYLHTAEQYVPSQEDIKKAAQNAGMVVSNYLPESVAGYLGNVIGYHDFPVLILKTLMQGQLVLKTKQRTVIPQLQVTPTMERKMQRK